MGVISVYQLGEKSHFLRGGEFPHLGEPGTDRSYSLTEIPKVQALNVALKLYTGSFPQK